MKKTKRLLSVFLALVMIVSIASICMVPSSAASTLGEHRVTQNYVNMRSAPGTSFGINGTLMKDYIVYVVQVDVGTDGYMWCRISKWRNPSGTNQWITSPVGWIRSDYLA